MSFPTINISMGLGSYSWTVIDTDISSDFLELYIKRGRTHELDRMEAGTATIILKNFHGKYWPANTASPYYPYVRSRAPVRITATYGATTYTLFLGFAESWVPNWLSDRGGIAPIITVTCVDLLKYLARCNITDATGWTAEDSGTRVDRLLDAIGWPSEANPPETAIYRAIDTGTYTLQATGPLNRLNALEHLYKIQESEGSLFFVGCTLQNPTFMAVYMNSNRRNLNDASWGNYATSQVTYADNLAGGALRYIKPELSLDDYFLYNQVNCQNLGDGVNLGLIQTANDAPSQTNNGIITLDKLGLLLNADSDAKLRADYLLNRFKESELRVKNLFLLPSADPDNIFPKVLRHDISTRITVNLNSANNPANISEDYHIEGIEHRCKASDRVWETNYQLRHEDSGLQFIAAHTGSLSKVDAVYNTAHNAATGTANNDADALVGQQETGGLYVILRSVIEWDTSSLGAGATIQSANLLLYSSDLNNDNPYYIYVVDPTINVGYPLVADDYGDLLPQVAQCGFADSELWNSAGWNKIDLNANGIALINKTGTTRLALRSSREINSNVPGAGQNEYMRIEGIIVGYKPILVVRLA